MKIGFTVDTSKIDLLETKATTAGLERELKNTSDIKIYLKKFKKYMLSRTLSEQLELLLSKKKMRIADVVRDSQLDRTYVYQIFSGKRTPSRDKLIAITFGLHLSDNETQNLLKLSGNRKLYVKDERDAIILFSIQQNKNILETNELLFDYGFTPLGTPME